MEVYYKNRKGGYATHVGMNVIENSGEIIALLFFMMFSTGRRVHQGRNSWTGFQLVFLESGKALRARTSSTMEGGIYLSRYNGEDTFLNIEERVTETFRQINGLYRPEVWQKVPVVCWPATLEEIDQFSGYYPGSWSFVGHPESVCTYGADRSSLLQEGEESWPGPDFPGDESSSEEVAPPVGPLGRPPRKRPAPRPRK